MLHFAAMAVTDEAKFMKKLLVTTTIALALIGCGSLE